jgi:hypothetical protein
VIKSSEPFLTVPGIRRMSSSQGEFELDDVDIYDTEEAHETHAAAGSSDGEEDGSDRPSFAGQTSHKVGVDIAGKNPSMLMQIV